MEHLERTAGYDMDAWSHIICDSSSMPVRPLLVGFEGVDMPSVSKAQRRLAGMALAARRGEGEASGGMMGMSLADLEHFASTRDKGLPERKKQKRGKK